MQPAPIRGLILAIYHKGWGMGNFPGGSVLKNLPVKARDAGSTPGSGRSPGEGNGNPLQYSCFGNPMNRGTWQASVYGLLFCKDLDKP